MATVVYYESGGVGNWYECVAPTQPGESPDSNPEKWVRLDIPAFMENILVTLALRSLLRGEGQSDKALAELRTASAEFDLLVLRYADPPRTQVMTR